MTPRAPRAAGSLRAVLARLVLVLAIVLGALIAVAISGTVVTARDYRQGAQQAIERQDAANELLTTLLTAQNANRSYTLLARGDDLRAYLSASDRYVGDMRRLRGVLRGDDELAERADAVDRTAQLWFGEARDLISLLRRGQPDLARRRVNSGFGEDRFAAFRAEHRQLLRGIERARLDGLAANDRRRELTLIAIVLAAILALLIVTLLSRQLWRRVGGPIALITAGVGRVARGRLTDPVPASAHAVRELVELRDGFNTMLREVQQERDAVAAAARREAVQKTERRLWETVQSGLLPARLPGVPGLRVTARYAPAERALLVGGDFYDAVVLPDGRLAVMVGDMAGHGAPAAAQAAGLRFGWRTLVAVNPNPAAVMAALNAQMAAPSHRAEGLFASAIYMLIDPRGSVSFAPAGHPPPFILTAAICQPLEPASTGPLLGVFDEAEWPVTHAALPPGGTIVLYTDGLVEARRGADLFGVERACATLAAERRSALELRVERLLEAARRHEDQSLRDDVVIVAVERPRPIGWMPPERPPAGRAATNGAAAGARPVAPPAIAPAAARRPAA